MWKVFSPGEFVTILSETKDEEEPKNCSMVEKRTKNSVPSILAYYKSNYKYS
jgi:hypothetical protein